MPTLSDVPSAPGANLLGHGHRFRSDRTTFLRAVGQAGELSRVRFLHRDVLFANSPATAHELLVERARACEKSPGIRLLLHHLAGRGLFTAEGELWRRQRRLMAPLFSPAAAGRYARTMHDVAARALARFRDGDAIDLSREATRVTMGVVSGALFDSDTFDEADDLGAALTTALSWVERNMASPALVAHLVLQGAAAALPAALG
ncbi:MAG TPA: cytochrome P450, partial [Polyangiaceae bacterium]|nr:cytochrome P450 [Polyangiaceae bacterium]